MIIKLNTENCINNNIKQGIFCNILRNNWQWNDDINNNNYFENNINNNTNNCINKDIQNNMTNDIN